MRLSVLLLLPLLIALHLALHLGAMGSAQAQEAPGLEGRIIQRIDFAPPDQPLPLAELYRRLPLRAGTPLNRAGIRDALQKLNDTGRYSNVSIEAELAGDGVIVRIETELNYFVSGVSVDGATDPPSRGQLLSAAKLELGGPFEGGNMAQALANMRERLQANGLYLSKLEYRLTPTPASEEMSVHFDLDAGQRARLDGAKVTGNFSKPVADIIRSARWRRGFGRIVFPGWSEATENRVQSGLDRIRGSFQSDNHLQARVTLEQLDYHVATNTVTPSLTIEAGPVIEVRTSGANVSRNRLRQLIPIYEERTVDRSLLLEGNRNLTDYFQSQGFFEATVDFSESTGPGGVQVIDYAVERNARHKLVAIEITGNHFFDAPTIRERLTVQEAGKLRDRHGRYSQRLRDQDRAAIRELYRSNGFRDADVKATTLDDYRGRQDELGIRFEIVEGPQWFIDRLQIDGAPAGEADALRGVLQSVEGQVYSESNIGADRDAILGYFFNNGYPEASFDWEQVPTAAPQRVSLHYTIRTGQRQYVRDVLVRGLETTDPGLVAARILLRPGDALSQSQIGLSQQKLYDLGIFAKVQTAAQNPGGQEESKYVLFQLDEANKYSVNAGVGAEIARIGTGVATLDAPVGNAGFSPRVSLGVSRLNFWGLGHTVSLQTRASLLQQRAVASYLAPQFRGNENISLSVAALFDTSRDVRTFAARRWEGSLQLQQRLSRANTMQYRFSFRRVTVDQNTLNISPLLIPLLSQPVRVGLVAMSFIQDRRDNPTDSHRGAYNTVDAGISLPQFGSKTDYTRLVLRNSTYHPIGKEMVLARTLQFGYLQRLGGLAQIPFSERFFAGGASSQRAFPDNQAGPRDLTTGFPLGGNAMLFHSTELRFPLFGENMGGVLFHDMGNVYSDVTEISFRYHQGSNQQFNYTVQAAGFGIRYRTPVGPIRVDFSYSPNAPRFFGFQGTREQLLANPIQGIQTNQKISSFQFHFSLGQTF